MITPPSPSSRAARRTLWRTGRPRRRRRCSGGRGRCRCTASGGEVDDDHQQHGHLVEVVGERRGAGGRRAASRSTAGPRPPAVGRPARTGTRPARTVGDVLAPAEHVEVADARAAPPGPHDDDLPALAVATARREPGGVEDAVQRPRRAPVAVNSRVAGVVRMTLAAPCREHGTPPAGLGRRSRLRFEWLSRGAGPAPRSPARAAARSGGGPPRRGGRRGRRSGR